MVTQEKSEVLPLITRRMLVGPGSHPPFFRTKCKKCTPCTPILVLESKSMKSFQSLIHRHGNALVTRSYMIHDIVFIYHNSSCYLYLIYFISKFKYIFHFNSSGQENSLVNFSSFCSWFFLFI